MLSDLRVALVQTELYWKNSIANLAMLEEKIRNMEEPADLIILPEMFTTGFTMEPEEVAEPMNFLTTKWMKQLAAQTGAVITGSLVIKEVGSFFNRLLWVDPSGNVQKYDKRHLFRMANEDRCYKMGDERAVFQWKGWKILPQICYDLRFPVWSRNRLKDSELEYDIVFYVASWPSPRVKAWDTLLQSRAIENLSYSIGVNRIGSDGNGILYPGHSAAYDFKGERLVFGDDKDCILHFTINYEDLVGFREKFPAWMDADHFDLKPSPNP